MIEFTGEVSNDFKLYMAKKTFKFSGVYLIIISFIFSIPTTLILLKAQKEGMLFFVAEIAIGVLAAFLVFGIVLLISSLIPKSVAAAAKKYSSSSFANKIIIDNDMVISENRIYKATGLISDVKKVVDQGEWYFILFKYSNKRANCICQKNLITKGTIEDFEALFGDKIVRSKRR